MPCINHYAFCLVIGPVFLIIILQLKSWTYTQIVFVLQKYIHWSEFKHSPLVQSSISLELSGSEALSSGEQISLVCTKNDTLQQELQIALRRLSISESQIQV